MKKLIISLLTVILFSTTASAVTYRGFVDTGVGVISGNNVSSVLELSFSTTHGVQINRHFFVGAGISYLYGYEMSYDAESSHRIANSMSLAPYLALRYDVDVAKRWSPFIECRIGKNVFSSLDYDYDISNAEFSTLFINPRIGVRLKISSRCAFNFAISYIPYNIDVTYTEQYWSSNSWNTITGDKNLKLSNISFNLGFDF